MSKKRIHKTLEEVEAENDYNLTHQDSEVESLDAWGDYDASESFDEMAGAADELLSEPTPPPAPARKSTRRTQRTSTDRRPTQAKAPTTMTVVGAALAISGFVMSALAVFSPGSLGSIATNLAQCGLTPGLITMIGVVVMALTAVIRNHQAQFQTQLNWVAGQEESANEMLTFLVTQAEEGSNRPAEGEEFQQVLHSLARQDEKINNITKALRMYGKPLVDVNRQAMENGQKTKTIASQLSELASRGQDTASLDALRDQIAHLESQVLRPLSDTIKQNSRDSVEEMMKAIELLADQVSTDVSQSISAIPKDESSERVLAETRRGLDATRKGMEDMQAQLLDQLTTQITSQVATQIQQAVAGLQSTIAAAPVAASAAASAPAPAVAPAPQATPAPAPTPAAKPSGGGGAGGLANSISGTAKADSKSVMGAIAKLKKMR